MTCSFVVGIVCRRSLRRSDHRPGAVRPLGGAVRGEALQGHTEVHEG